MTSHRAVPALSLAALLAACGSGSSSEKPLDLQGFVNGYADTVCSALVRCSCTDATALADCKTSHREYMTYLTAEMFLQYPGVRVDPAGARTCLADMAAAMQSCPSPTGGGEVPTSASVGPMRAGPGLFLDVPSCKQALLFVGVQTAGEHCADASECATGLTCDLSQDKCVTAPGLEDPCQVTDGRCAEGLYCSGAGSNTCATIPALGEGCNGSDRTCAEGSTCVQVSGVYTCIAPHVVDDGCTDGAGCAAGLYCDGSTCKTLVPDDGDCSYDVECAHGWCNAGTCADPGFCGAGSSPI